MLVLLPSCLNRALDTVLVSCETNPSIGKQDWLRVHLCGFPVVIREFLFRKASFEPLFAVQFATLATRMCHLHFAPQAPSKADKLVVWLFGCMVVWLSVLFGTAQRRMFEVQCFVELHSPVFLSIFLSYGRGFAYAKLEQLSSA